MIFKYFKFMSQVVSPSKIVKDLVIALQSVHGDKDRFTEVDAQDYLIDDAVGPLIVVAPSQKPIIQSKTSVSVRRSSRIAHSRGL